MAYPQRPPQRPPPGSYDSRRPPQAAGWNGQTQDGYFDQGYTDYGYENYHYPHGDGGYNDAGYDARGDYGSSQSYGPPQAQPRSQRSGYGSPAEQQYDRNYGYGARQDQYGGQGGYRAAPDERRRMANGGGDRPMNRPPPGMKPVRPSERQPVRPPPSPEKMAWDNPFPVFPAKEEKRKPSLTTNIEKGMAAMDLTPTSPVVRSPERPHTSNGRRPDAPRQQPRAPPSQGSSPGWNGGEHRDAPMRSASGNQSAAAPLDYGVHDAPPPMPHIGRSATMPIQPATAVSPPVTQPLYPGQATYQEPGHTPSPLSSLPPRPSTAGGSRPTMPRANTGAPTTGFPLSDPIPEASSASHDRYDPDDVLDSYYGTSHADEPDMPNFDAMPDPGKGAAIDESLPGLEQPKPKTPAPPTTTSASTAGYAAYNPGFAAQAHRAQSQPDLRAAAAPNQFGNAGFQFDLPSDTPPVPQVHQDSTGYGSNRAPPQAYEEPMQAQYPQRHGSRGASGPAYPGPQAGYPPRGPPPPQPYERSMSMRSNGPPRPYRVNQPGPPMEPLRTTPEMDPQQNPDALPHHPVPFRPGHDQAKPAPVRQYASAPGASATPPPPAASQSRPSAERATSAPVTHDELQKLQQMAKGRPNDQKTQLLLAKKLVEAATVLVGDNTRADLKTKAKMREKYVMDGYKIVKKLAQSGYPEAQFYLADCYGSGEMGLAVDPKEAFHLYHSAAKAGHAQSAYRVAVCCEIGSEEGGGTKRDPFKAVQWYKRAAALGDPPAMYKMGMIMLKGLLGQARNPREGISWLKRAAERADEENPHALHELGLMYESASNNDIIIRDEEYAKQLFHQAAELGYKFSQFRLGAAYEYGLMGCPVDPRQSIIWYTKAAAQGEHQAELALSGWYLTGSEGNLQQSDTEAYLWARKAAAAGLPKAEYAMGYFTEVGIGITANLDDAKRWYWRAAAQGFPKARERLEDLKRGGSRMQKTRLSRSNVKQNEGDCVLM